MRSRLVSCWCGVYCDSVRFRVVKPAGLFLYPGTFAGAAPVTTFKIVTIGEDLTEVVVGGGGPLWLAVVGGDRRAAARPFPHARRRSVVATFRPSGEFHSPGSQDA